MLHEKGYDCLKDTEKGVSFSLLFPCHLCVTSNDQSLNGKPLSHQLLQLPKVSSQAKLMSPLQGRYGCFLASVHNNLFKIFYKRNKAGAVLQTAVLLQTI